MGLVASRLCTDVYGETRIESALHTECVCCSASENALIEVGRKLKLVYIRHSILRYYSNHSHSLSNDLQKIANLDILINRIHNNISGAITIPTIVHSTSKPLSTQMVTRTLSDQSAPPTCIRTQRTACTEEPESGSRGAGRAGHPHHRNRSVTPPRAGHPHYRKSSETAVHPRCRSPTPRPSAGHPHYRAAAHPRFRSVRSESLSQTSDHPRCRSHGKRSGHSRDPSASRPTVSAGHPHYRTKGETAIVEPSSDGERHGRRGGRGRRPAGVHPRLRNITPSRLASDISADDCSQDEGKCSKRGGRGGRCGRTASPTGGGEDDTNLHTRLTGPHAHRVHAHAFPHSPRGERTSSPGRRGRGGRVQNPMAADQVVRAGRPCSRGGKGGRGRDGGSRRPRSPTPDAPSHHGRNGGGGRRGAGGMRRGGRGGHLN